MEYKGNGNLVQAVGGAISKMLGLKPESKAYNSQTGTYGDWNYNYDQSTGKYTPMKKGGKVKSASARADGCAVRGKTRAK